MIMPDGRQPRLWRSMMRLIGSVMTALSAKRLQRFGPLISGDMAALSDGKFNLS